MTSSTLASPAFDTSSASARSRNARRNGSSTRRDGHEGRQTPTIAMRVAARGPRRNVFARERATVASTSAGDVGARARRCGQSRTHIRRGGVERAPHRAAASAPVRSASTTAEVEPTPRATDVDAGFALASRHSFLLRVRGDSFVDGPTESSRRKPCFSMSRYSVVRSMLAKPRRLRHVGPRPRDELRQVLLLEMRDELVLRQVEALGHDARREARSPWLGAARPRRHRSEHHPAERHGQARQAPRAVRSRSAARARCRATGATAGSRSTRRTGAARARRARDAAPRSATGSGSRAAGCPPAASATAAG